MQQQPDTAHEAHHLALGIDPSHPLGHDLNLHLSNFSRKRMHLSVYVARANLQNQNFTANARLHNVLAQSSIWKEKHKHLMLFNARQRN